MIKSEQLDCYYVVSHVAPTAQTLSCSLVYTGSSFLWSAIGIPTYLQTSSVVNACTYIAVVRQGAPVIINIIIHVAKKDKDIPA